jgi:3',5'-cyclic AMP phosphodiesterase CpdA
MAKDDGLLATLVHISDLHIGDIDPSTGNASANALAAWVVKKFSAFDGLLGHQGRSLQDLTRFWKTYPRPARGLFRLIVTGDYTRCGGATEFQTVKEYLTSEVNLGTTLSPSRTGLKLPALPAGIPGNHDQWGGVNFPWSGFQSVFRNSALSKATPYVQPPEQLANGLKLVVCGIDSDADVNRLSLDRFRAIGAFQSQLARLAKTLGPNPGDEVRVLLVHHSWNHQGPILRMTGASKNAMRNFVVAHGVKIVLSGHTHGAKMLPISLLGRPDAHELCCGTTTQLDNIPFEWSNLMGKVPNRKWPENTLLVHQLRVDGADLKWEAQPWFRDVQNGFQAANYSYAATL